MEQLIKNIIPSIKHYGELLSQKSILQKTWLLINDHGDLIQYTFKKGGELIISINGDVIKGKWELLSSTKILLDIPNSSIQLENLFFNKGIIVLLKQNKNNELFILINEEIIIDNDPLKYLNELQKREDNNQIKSDPSVSESVFITIGIVTALIIFLYAITR